jgi:hypothetical protein
MKSRMLRMLMLGGHSGVKTGVDRKDVFIAATIA